MTAEDPVGLLTNGVIPYLIAAWFAFVVGNIVWSARLRKVARRYEELRVSLGGAALRGSGKNASARSPLVQAGWGSLVPTVLIVAFLMTFDASFLRDTPIAYVFAAVVLINAGQIAYNEFLSKWARPRRLLRRAVLAFDDESRELAIREALAADPDVGGKARAEGVTKPAADVAVVSGYMGDSPAPGAPDAGATGPRFSDAPPPL